MEHNLDTQRHAPNQSLTGTCYAVGFSRWKQRFVGCFLPADLDIRFRSADDVPPLFDGMQLIVWASKVDRPFVQRCKEAGVKLWRMEDGFIRSVGLGVDLTPPLSLVVDSRGIYYDATRPSDLEHLLATRDFSTALVERARHLRRQLVDLGISKYNVGVESPLALPTNKIRILVPGQVETDASIALGSPHIKTNHELLSAVRAAKPDSFIIYKPHPDVVCGGRKGELPAGTAKLYDLEVTDIGMAQLLPQIDEVHTLTSLTGFEALLRGIKVTTYGLPFYAGWGQTDDQLSCERRGRRLDLDELVAATLILYPTYIDPDSHQRCEVETAVKALARQRNGNPGPSLLTRAYRIYRKLFEGVK